MVVVTDVGDKSGRYEGGDDGDKNGGSGGDEFECDVSVDNKTTATSPDFTTNIVSIKC